MDPLKTKKALILDLHGSETDYIILCLCLLNPSIDLMAVSINPARSYEENIVESVQRIIRLFSKEKTKIAVGDQYGRYNCLASLKILGRCVNLYPLLQAQRIEEMTIEEEPSHVFLSKLIEGQNSKVNIICTGPLSNVAALLKTSGKIHEKIEKIVFCGGTLAEKGDVIQHNTNGKAENRFYIDPEAVKAVLESSVEKVMIPLEAADGFSQFTDLFEIVGKSSGELIEFVGFLLSLVTVHWNGKIFNALREFAPFFYLLNKDYFEVKSQKISVICDWPDEGVIAENESGHNVNLLSFPKKKAQMYVNDLISMLTNEKKIEQAKFQINEQNIGKNPVFIEADGSIDGLLTLLLAKLYGLEVAGVGVFQGNKAPANILSLFNILNLSKAKLSKNELYTRNDWPYPMREMPAKVNNLPIFHKFKPDFSLIEPKPTHHHIISILEQSKEKITFILTGSCVNFSKAILLRPDLKSKVEEVVFTGGCFSQTGEVELYSHDGTAERNAFIDPDSLDFLVKSGLKPTLIPFEFSKKASEDLMKFFDYALKKSIPESNHSELFAEKNLQLFMFFMQISAYFTPISIFKGIFAVDYCASKSEWKTEAKEVEVALEVPSEGRTREVKGVNHWVNVAVTASAIEKRIGHKLGIN